MLLARTAFLVCSALFGLSQPLVAASKYAVLVGVAKYHPETIRGIDLKSPINDLALMQEVLSYYGFGAHEMLILADEKAQSDAIAQAVNNHLLTMERGSLAVFYFSGHGSKRRKPTSNVSAIQEPATSQRCLRVWGQK